ncbi:MAG: glycosyltransferase [Bacteroidetes bacterium]|nr:glycosyltransferase [Bacteroidota bacterium]MDA0904294.1 glycosyltransferase [Bacteroidota bacterium]MDA1241844.1 glycosyltransferase [Bacteroidota bacterium]
MIASWIAAAGQIHWAWRWDGVFPVITTSSLSWNPTDAWDETIRECSVIVCCRNEAEQLLPLEQGLLPALNRWENAGNKVEVVVVDDGSTDETWEGLLDIAKRDSRWKPTRIEGSRPGKKDAITHAMGMASFHVRVLLDADCRPRDASWLAHMTHGASTSWDVMVGVGWPVEAYNREARQAKGWLARLQVLEAQRLAQKAVGAARGGRPYLAFGRNMALTKTAWEMSHGMDSHSHIPSGDDDLWLQEAVAGGARVLTCIKPEAHTESAWPTTWKAWRRQKTRHFSASPSYPWTIKLWLLVPGMLWWVLVAGVVHNPGVVSIGALGLALTHRTLTFGLFLRQTGQPGFSAWRLVLEPAVSAFRVWSWWRGQQPESTPWK